MSKGMRSLRRMYWEGNGLKDRHRHSVKKMGYDKMGRGQKATERNKEGDRDVKEKG